MTGTGDRLVARIDLDRLAGNWRELDRLSGEAECAAVVKAEAYGHGMAVAARALHHAGCRFFFTASVAEAAALRAVLPDARIGCFEGPTASDRDAVAEAAIMPSVNSIGDLRVLDSWAAAAGAPVPAMLQLDTGMNRLGVGKGDLDALAADGAFDSADWQLVFSHLASSEEADNPQNGAQRRLFDAMLAGLPALPASLAATGGILLGEEYHYQLTRPGIGLYGLPPRRRETAAIKPVLGLRGRILQIRSAAAGETVGYNGTAVLSRPSRLATVAGGYADGIPRQLGDRGEVHCRSRTAPMVGRISMDSAVADITDWPEDHAAAGDFVDLIHDGFTADAMAGLAGTIGYDILTGLGQRAVPHYAGAVTRELGLDT